MNVGSEKAQIEIEEDTTLNNTNKWTTEMKVNLPKTEERERTQSCGFMKRMEEARGDIYENSTMSAQTLRHNTARFHKDSSLLNLVKVRDGNDVEAEEIQIRVVEPVSSQENIEEIESRDCRANKILGKYLGNTNICTVIDAVYAMRQTIKKRKGLKRNEKRK